MFCINLSTHPLAVPSVICVSIQLSRLEELRLVYSFGCCLIQVNFAGSALFLTDPSPIIVYPCHSLTDWLSNVVKTWLMWPMPTQLKTCWCCYCCWCWWWRPCWQLCGRDFDADYCSRYWGWDLVKILKLMFSWYFEAEVWSSFWNWSWVKILRLKFGQDFEAKFGPDCVAQDWSTFWARSLVKILKLKFG